MDFELINIIVVNIIFIGRLLKSYYGYNDCGGKNN